jgi:hypothetical protein
MGKILLPMFRPPKYRHVPRMCHLYQNCLLGRRNLIETSRWSVMVVRTATASSQNLTTKHAHHRLVAHFHKAHCLMMMMKSAHLSSEKAFWSAIAKRRKSAVYEKKHGVHRWKPR